MALLSFAIAALCLAGKPQTPGQLATVKLVSGLNGAMGYIANPTDPSLAYVVIKNGRVRILKNNVLQTTNFLKIPDAAISTGSERGLLSIAFHPKFATNHYVFAHFNNPDGSIQVSRFTLNTTTNVLDYPTRYDIITIPHPGQDNHNGGTIRFGPHQYLYIATGDGGGANDQPNNSQNLGVLLGKMLRLNVNKDSFPNDPTRNYTIPADNPFVATPGAAPEIFAYGLRNPFKFCFDSANQNLVIADVGQTQREEIDVLPAGTSGQNFGWRIREGTIANPAYSDPTPPGAVDPVFDYPHTSDWGDCITGGQVVRNKRLGAAYLGRYFFSDFITGRVWSANPYATDVASTVVEHTNDLALNPSDVVSIDLTAQKDLVLVTHSGTIYLVKKAGA